MGDTPEETVIFRRFIRLKDGRVLDAQEYGHVSWPIRIRRRKRTQKTQPKG